MERQNQEVMNAAQRQADVNTVKANMRHNYLNLCKTVPTAATQTQKISVTQAMAQEAAAKATGTTASQAQDDSDETILPAGISYDANNCN